MSEQVKDTFLTIAHPAEGQITEKRSKFLAFAYPVCSTDEVKTLLNEARKKFYDARHICWAYILGANEQHFRTNDDGEPSGTAGKPILGQIRSKELTNTLVMVIRYFGGTKLGTSGLISAYKHAAATCLENAQIRQQTINHTLDIHFDYIQINKVMQIIKELSPNILQQDFDNRCHMSLQIRTSLSPLLINKLQHIEGIEIKESY